MKIVIFDFDKTLTFIDSGLLFCIYNLLRPRYLLRYVFHNEAFEQSYERKKVYHGLPKAIIKLNVRTRMLKHLNWLCDRNYNVVLLTGSCQSTINDYKDVLPFEKFDRVYTLEDFLETKATNLMDGKLKVLDPYQPIYHFVNDSLKEINAVRSRAHHCFKV